MNIYGNTVGHPLPDPRKGMEMSGPINMNGQAIKGLNAPTADDEAVNWGSVKDIGKAKAGFIYPLAASVVPEGFLLCDGAAYARSEYPELFAAIGTMYGSGDGTTTFNVPDLRNRVPAGSSDNHPAGEMVGEEAHQLTVDEMPSHTHGGFGESGSADWEISYGQDPKLSFNRDDGISYTGGNQPHNNMQPTTYIHGYIIATGKGTGVSVADIINGAQAIPLGLEYGGTGATDPKTARENLEITPENIGAMSMELLWENASPTSSFESQNISLPSTAYPFYLARFRLRNDADWYENVIAAPYEYSIASVPTTHANVAGGNIYNRRFAVSPDTAYFDIGKMQYGDAETLAGYYLIPVEIYGIKGVSA